MEYYCTSASVKGQKEGKKSFGPKYITPKISHLPIDQSKGVELCILLQFLPLF